MHLLHVDGLTPTELAQRIANLRYDALKDFLLALAGELAAQSRADGERGRSKLAQACGMASHSLEMTTMLIETAWTISQPYMKELPKPPQMQPEEAEQMLKRLSAHFKEPVMPIKRYCKGITDWFEAIIRMNSKASEEEKYRLQGADYWKHLSHIWADMQKSNLLWRRLYLGEQLRKEKCPYHDGHWDGQAMMAYGCEYGCSGTGWLPNTPEAIEAAAWVHASIRWRDPSKLSLFSNLYFIRFQDSEEIHILKLGRSTRSPVDPNSPVTYQAVRLQDGPKGLLRPGAVFTVLDNEGLGCIQMGDPPEFDAPV